MCVRGVNFASISNQMKNRKYHAVGTVPKSNIKIIERGKIDMPNTQIHARSPTWLGTYTSINQLVLWDQTSPFSLDF
jgi:hypothetical protein